MNAKTASRWRNVILDISALGALLFLSPTVRAQETSESLFKGKCAMCHGPDGAGKTMMGEKLKIPDLHSADVQKKSDADLKTVIATGKDKMPGYESKLSKEQLASVVAFIRDLAKKH
jgi:mono/diheme cytochrome c family protein